MKVCHRQKAWIACCSCILFSIYVMFKTCYMVCCFDLKLVSI